MITSRFAPRGLRPAAMAAAVTLAAPMGAFAHHSFAMYDQNKLLVLNGTVQSFEWTNPHALLFVVGSTANDQPPILWSIELSTSPGNLSRMGWTKRSLKEGDKVLVDINPLRDGHHGGSLKKVTLTATGEVLTTSGTGAPAPATR